MAESVYPGNENNFMGVKCGSLTALNSNYCPGQSFPMGYATPKNLKGNFFLKTNSDAPYGVNSTNIETICKNGKPPKKDNKNMSSSKDDKEGKSKDTTTTGSSVGDKRDQSTITSYETTTSSAGKLKTFFSF